ncbi:DUF4089 domain-containing protein [Labrys neptuniae]
MSDKPEFDAQAVIDAMAPLIGIEIAPDFREGVATILKMAADMAELVLSAPIGDADPSGPAFEA